MTRAIIILAALLPAFANARDELPLEAPEYSLKITHEANHPKVPFPTDPIADDQFHATGKGATLRLKLSEDRKRVDILPEKISGNLIKVDGDSRIYDLAEGLFAGGRLTIEKKKAGLVATLTVFGSGVPVISSARGSLKRAAP